LNNGYTGLLDVDTLVFHHIVKFRISSNFNHVQFAVGIFDHSLKELFDGVVFFRLVVDVVEVNFKFECNSDFIDLSISIFSVFFKIFCAHFVGVKVES
jgi:hypothetical protein